MNIKKIIQEEMADMDWIRDIDPKPMDELKELTADNPNINVETNVVRDQEGRSYFHLDDFDGGNLTWDDITWEEILNVINDNVLEHIKKLYSELSEDDRDFRDLHNIIVKHLAINYPEMDVPKPINY